MAPLASNLTDRWFMDYVTGNASTSVEHTMQLRLGSNAGIDGASAAFLAILQGFGASRLWTGWRVIRLRYQAAGTNFSIPVTPGTTLAAFTGSASVAGRNEASEAIEVTAQARSVSTGRRVDLSLYGYAAQYLGAFRATPPDPAVVGMIGALNGLVNPALAADGSQVVWYNYLNFNYNSYWERRKRGV